MHNTVRVNGFMLMKHLLLFACLMGFSPIFATTIVPYEHLGAAARYSEAVVLARAEQPLEFRHGDLVYQDTRFQVLSSVKGPLAAGQFFDLRPLSKQAGNYFAEVAGDFEPTLGKTYLLFLYRSGEAWRAQLLSYYVMEESSDAGQFYLAPLDGIPGTEVLPRPDGIVPEPLYRYHRDALLQALRDYASGAATVWDAAHARANRPTSNLAEDRALPSYCDFMLGSSTVLARWVNASVDVYYDDTGVPGGFDATLTTLLGDMVANYTGISPFNGGQASYVPDCSDNTPTNASELFPFFDANLNGTQSALIMFNDPCNEIGALNNCGGTLAYGGSYRFGTGTNHVYKGDTWQDSGYGYVVVNDGVPGCYAGLLFQQLLEHELTHAYRMDHISSTTHPSHNMNPSCCSPINTGDRDCMNYTYDLSPLPVALRTFNAKTLGAQVLLSWTTESELHSNYFLLERSADGLHFQPLGRVTAKNKVTGGHYEWLDPKPLKGTGYYRLTQVDLNGQQTQLGIRTVQMDGQAPVFSLAPNPVGSNGPSSSLLLQNPERWEGTISIVGPEGVVHYNENLALESGTHRLALPARALPGGVYRVVLRDKEGVKVLNLSKL